MNEPPRLSSIIANILDLADRNNLGLISAGIAFFALMSLFPTLAAPVVLSFLPIGWMATISAGIARFVLSVAAIVFALGLICRYAPNRRGDRPGWVTHGAVLAAILWLVVSSAFSAYLARFSVYNEIYGSIGAMVALLMWL